LAAAWNCLKVPDITGKLVLTLFAVAAFRILAQIPLPGLESAALASRFKSLSEEAFRGTGEWNFLTFIDLVTGGALGNGAIGALGILPANLMALVAFQTKKAEARGNLKARGREPYWAVALCLTLGCLLSLGFEHASWLCPGFEGRLVRYESIWRFRIETTLILACSGWLLIWMVQCASRRGLTDGYSLFITVALLGHFPQAGRQLLALFTMPGRPNGINPRLEGMILLLMAIAILVSLYTLLSVERKVPVQYAQQAMGGKKFRGGGTSFMPLRLAYFGTIPILNTLVLLVFCRGLLVFFGKALNVGVLIKVAAFMRQDSLFFLAIWAGMIFATSWVWVFSQFNAAQIAEDLEKHGGYVPGVRPGQATANYLDSTVMRLALAGIVFTEAIALIPMAVCQTLSVPFEAALFFDGVGLVLLITPALVTLRQVKWALLVHHNRQL